MRARFTIQVKDRVHLIRNLRGVAGVTRVERQRN
jgi:GTP pyrophosphokinase